MSDNAFEYLKSNKELFELYSDLIRKLDDLTRLKVKKRDSYLKTIVLCNRKNFACISLLDDSSSIMDKSFKLIFYIGEEIKDNRVRLTPQHQPSDFVYYITIKKKSDIDTQLIGWLKQSYDKAK